MRFFNLESRKALIMKQIFFYAAIAFVMASCSKDSLSLNPVTDGIADDQAFISVIVMSEHSATEDGGCVSNESSLAGVEGAWVYVSLLADEGSGSGFVTQEATTDKFGRVIFGELPEGKFHVEVVSRVGNHDRIVTTSAGKMTKLYIAL